MNVEERILLERICSATELGETEQRIVEADERLQALIEDNRMLAGIADVSAAEPPRGDMLAGLGEVPEVRKGLGAWLGFLNGWPMGLAGSLAMLALIQLGWNVAHQPSSITGSSPAWASSDGYTIVYELAGSQGFSTSESGLGSAIEQWRSEIPSEMEPLAVRVRSSSSNTRVVLSASRVDERQVGRLVELIADRTGMADPQVTGTTLFDNAGHGPTDLVSGEPAGIPLRHEPSLERIAGLFAGEPPESMSGAFVHGGGGQIILGRYNGSGDELGNLPFGLIPRERIASVADGECTAVGALPLFSSLSVPAGHADQAVVHGWHFRGGPAAGVLPGTGSEVPGGEFDPERFRQAWQQATGISGGEGAVWEQGPGQQQAIAWTEAGQAPSAWVVGRAGDEVEWKPATSLLEGSEGAVFSFAPAPSRFIVLEDQGRESPAPLPEALAGPGGFSFWAPAPDGREPGSFRVLERSQGNHRLLPGYTIFGNTTGMRVFSFPAGSTKEDIQQRLDDWYERNGRRISFNVGLQTPLTEDLLLIVAEGVDSDQSLVILSEDAAVEDASSTKDVPGAAPQAAPQPCG